MYSYSTFRLHRGRKGKGWRPWRTSVHNERWRLEEEISRIEMTKGKEREQDDSMQTGKRKREKERMSEEESGGRCYARRKGKARVVRQTQSSNGWETQSFFISALSSVSFHPAKQSSSFLPSSLSCSSTTPVVELFYPFSILLCRYVRRSRCRVWDDGKTNEPTFSETRKHVISSFPIFPLSSLSLPPLSFWRLSLSRFRRPCRKK